MKSIAVLGAGLSSASLFRYLISNMEIFGWKLKIANWQIQDLKVKFGHLADVQIMQLDAPIS